MRKLSFSERKIAFADALYALERGDPGLRTARIGRMPVYVPCMWPTVSSVDHTACARYR
jgi:hypothetical protein